MPPHRSIPNQQPDQTLPRPPEPRQGPRPLLLHLMTEAMILGGCCSVSQALRNGSPYWNDRLPPAAKLDQNGFALALEEEARRRYATFLQGITHYRQYRLPRRLAPPPLFWQAGTSRLHQFSEHGVPVLLIPSLVNRAVILDLTGSRSLVRYMARRGIRPFLMDWDAPGPEEIHFSLAGYIQRRLIPAAQAIHTESGQPPIILGYCMGGLLALALALCRPDLCAGYIGLATPWDFHAGLDNGRAALRTVAPHLSTLIHKTGFMATDLIQALFSMLDPGTVGKKFRAFANMQPRSTRANMFVAVEDWLNDGVPLAGPVAQECLIDWYVHNKPARKQWTVGGTCVAPDMLKAPSLLVIPTQDRIVPPDCARALAKALPNPQTQEVNLGHIGMVTGHTAPDTMYRPLVQWIHGAASQDRR